MEVTLECLSDEKMNVHSLSGIVPCRYCEQCYGVLWPWVITALLQQTKW